MVAQVANRLRPNAARPDVTIGSDLSRGHPGKAGDDLPLLDQSALDQVVVAVAKRLRDTRHVVELCLVDVLLELLDDGLVPLNRRRYAHPHGVQLHALLGDLAYEGVRSQLVLDEGTNLVEVLDVEVGDDRMHTECEVA